MSVDMTKLGAITTDESQTMTILRDLCTRLLAGPQGQGGLPKWAGALVHDALGNAGLGRVFQIPAQRREPSPALWGGVTEAVPEPESITTNDVEETTDVEEQVEDTAPSIKSGSIQTSKQEPKDLKTLLKETASEL